MSKKIIEFLRKKDFKLVEELGQGACGKTVLLYDDIIKERFVCKKYAPFYEHHKELLFNNFVQEIKLLHLINHKNVVRVFNYYIYSGSRYFCESFFGHPCPTSSKKHTTANACGCPSRPASLVRHPTRGGSHHPNDSTRFRKACIFTPHKTLRKNTCTIASGDYSTPVSQRSTQSKELLDQIRDKIRFNRYGLGTKKPILPGLNSSFCIIKSAIPWKWAQLKWRHF
ncbi:MAG: hypothetical protein WC685_12380 [Methylobacter sp.]|jgi:hypothetical protein